MNCTILFVASFSSVSGIKGTLIRNVASEARLRGHAIKRRLQCSATIVECVPERFSSEAQRLKQLEDENQRLKHLVLSRHIMTFQADRKPIGQFAAIGDDPLLQPAAVNREHHRPALSVVW